VVRRIIALAMKITILTTGGTIEKTYNEHDGSLKNYHTILPEMLDGLRIPDLAVSYEQVVFKDSLEIVSESLPQRNELSLCQMQSLSCTEQTRWPKPANSSIGN